MRLIAALCVFVCVASAGDTCVLPAGAILRVALAPNSPRSVKPNAVLEGSIGQPLYNATCRVLPAGVAVKAIADGAAMRVELAPPGLNPIAVKATVVRFATEKRAVAAGKPERAARMLLLRVDEAVSATSGIESASGGGGTIAAGTRVRVSLESGVSSKRSRQGETVLARLLEPVLADGSVLVPEGTVVHGTLAGARRARRLYRAGGLRVSFHSLQVAPARAVSAPMTVGAGQLSGGARVDGEGTITGSALTKKRALINLGIAYATGKILDDVIEEGAKAALGAAVAGSAETAARYVGLGAGLAVFMLHRGREVTLEPHTELVLTFSRPVEIAK